MALAALAVLGVGACGGGIQTAVPLSSNTSFTISAAGGTQSSSIVLNLIVNP
jgi:hypothetical protein